jgi:hypothetical protein
VGKEKRGGKSFGGEGKYSMAGSSDMRNEFFPHLVIIA